MNEMITATLDQDQKNGSHMGEKIFQTNNYHFAGIGHFAMDFAKLMTQGFDGVIQQAEDALAKLSKRDPEFASKRDYYKATLITQNAAKKYITRYADLANQMAANESDETRKQELSAMAENCYQIAGGVPQTFWQAVQLFNFATTLTQIEGNGHSISYGRMDQWLHPIYLADTQKTAHRKRSFLNCSKCFTSR
ncbi:pyruvate formate-lyase [Photobacterium aphoticum]|uniref:Pyruvate formate-lyase n=1 Tax=Photobacterium aphoticum TaxID=754436 RepID=A0A090QKZ6_9GAMM|nr:pyruvate formate-lyase [Photobacterium aphoticum]